MNLLDVLRYAAGGLKGHGLRTGLSLLGVAIGVASVIALTSLGEGARLFVTGEFASLGSNLLVVVPGKTETQGATPFISTAPNDLTVEDALALKRRVPAVAKVAPLSLGSVRVSFGERSREFTVLGTTHEMLDVRGLHVGVGRYLPIGMRDAPLCVIGPKVQRELFGSEPPLGKILRLGENRFRVIGVMQPRGTSIGMNLDEVVHVPVDTGLRMFNETSLFRLLLELNSHEDVARAKQAVIELLKERHAGQEDVTVLTQDAVLATFNKLLTALTAALVAIAAISLAVAGIGIMNVMLVSVAERTREIGLLKAVGVTSKQVVSVFLAEAAIISTAGGVIGLVIGVGAGRVFQHFQPDFPVRPPVWAVVAALAVSTAVGFAFGSMPARRAARLDPVNALMRKRT